MVLLLSVVLILEGIGKKVDEGRCPFYLCEECVNIAEQLEIVGWNFLRGGGGEIDYTRRRKSNSNMKMYYRVVINRLR